ncbi:MAG: hypothetical protein WB680_19005, partial [Candidatus Acidiferrales bacterium]
RSFHRLLGSLAAMKLQGLWLTQFGTALARLATSGLSSAGLACDKVRASGDFYEIENICGCNVCFIFAAFGWNS